MSNSAIFPNDDRAMRPPSFFNDLVDRLL